MHAKGNTTISTAVAEMDHVIAITNGGPDTKANIATTHALGNQRKHARTLEEYDEWLAAGQMTRLDGCGITLDS